ncbi:hypothetical protein Leryth_008492 [Lithospermum erythrorhizon]|nr:hypothetical protein Leryth_008492 [Lithospermum erythrorhizon]
MEESNISETRLTSAAAFVEGGIQDACDDSCSICLEEFCESDPATVTGCKHEYHLQCILEWCQRSSECPMCLQPINLKDPSSQELFDAVEHERNMRNQPRSTAIFHHPSLGDFELQHLPVNATDSELEEQILQHLAAAAAMGRTRHLVRREGQRGRPSPQGHSHYLVFSAPPSATSSAAVSPSEHRTGVGPAPAAIFCDSDSPLVTVGEDTGQMITPQSPAPISQVAASALGSSSDSRSHGTPTSSRRSSTQSSPSSQDSVGTSDLQSFSESLKTRLSAISTRYKESITKSTRGWRERLFTRNPSMPESRVEARRGADVATIGNMMERLGTTEDNSTSMALPTNSLAGSSPLPQTNQHSAMSSDHHSSTDEIPQPPRPASSASS